MLANSEDIAVTKFREYIRIDTEQPNPDYEKCTQFLKNYGDELGLEFSVTFPVFPGRPMVILTLAGQDKSLQSILLYSHTDVVPTFKEHWKHDPYSAVKDESGKIYGRGTQDMKSVGIQYLEAYRRLKNQGTVNFLRTIHFAFGADEEVPGSAMEKFVDMPEFEALNVGFALDEGIASENDTYKVFYGQRLGWWIDFTITGSPGHGSMFLQNNVGQKLRKFLDLAFDFRDSEEKRLAESDGKLTIGDVTTINLTKLSGGVQANVVPDSLSVTLDIRVTPSQADTFEKKIDSWMEQAGGGISYKFTRQSITTFLTPTTDDDAFWKAFSGTLKSDGLKYSVEVFPAGTDATYLREKRIKALGFSPMVNTPVLLHDHNEYLEESVFLRGVDIYTKMIKNLASVPSTATSP